MILNNELPTREFLRIDCQHMSCFVDNPNPNPHGFMKLQSNFLAHKPLPYQSIKQETEKKNYSLDITLMAYIYIKIIIKGNR